MTLSAGKLQTFMDIAYYRSGRKVCFEKVGFKTDSHFKGGVRVVFLQEWPGGGGVANW